MKKLQKKASYYVGFYLLFSALSFIRALATYMFIVPNAFAPGGIGGIASLLYNIVGQYDARLAETVFNPAVTIFVFNVPLLILALIKLNKQFFINTTIGVLQYSLFMALFSLCNFPVSRGMDYESGVMFLAALSGGVLASGGASGPAVAFKAQGNIGEVMVNPYKIAPLTAVVRNGGYVVKNATVTVLPKMGGQTIRYSVSDENVRTHAGIPVFGLYPDYLNTVEVEYDRVFNGKTEHFKDRYQFYTAPVFLRSNGTTGQTHTTFNAKVEKMDKAFNDRLYFVNNLIPTPPDASRFVWNNPMGGALEWAYGPENAIIDSTGTVRWYLLPDSNMYDPEQPYKSGILMGFQQTTDGGLMFGYGQRYAKYDMLGREIFNRRLPSNYSDYSHALDAAQNGHVFLRVASADLRRPDGKRVHTVRDVIAEVDADGRAVDEFRLFEILDPYRDNVIKALDQGAVCLNIDASQAGKTLSAEELAAMDKEDKFGDIPGVGPGRNWAHVNSVDYDPTDDSIIISSRHQSAIIKIGRDKKVKWILASPEGWKGDFAKKVLTPVDKDGNKIKCEGSVCEGGFDWTWTQHTAWRIDSKSTKDVIYVSAFDNGDARGMEQPALPEMKYTRGVVYKIDQKKMTVEQIYEVGKKEGHDYYSPVTGLTKYMDDKDSFFIYYSTAGLAGAPSGDKTGAPIKPHPYIAEYKFGETDPSVLIRLQDTMGYQAWPFNVQLAFDPAKAAK